MDLSTLKTQIKLNNLAPFYIFTGPEVEVMRQYIHQIAKVRNANIENVDSIQVWTRNLRSRRVLSTASIFVFRDCKDIINDDVLKFISGDSVASHGDISIFIFSSIDKRSKAYKNYQENMVEFLPLKDEILIAYIQKQIDLNEDSCRKLISICEGDYGRILLEVDKVKVYVESNTVNGEAMLSADEALAELIEEGTIYQPPYDAVFDFVDAVLKNQVSRSFNLLRQSYESGEATMVLLANLYNSAKQLLQVQSFDGSGKITEVTGLTPFQIKLASGRKGKNSNGDLIYLMGLVRDAERGIKVGDIEDQIAVQNILVHFWGY